MACDDDRIPLSQRIGDQADLEDIYSTRRNFLYVAYSIYNRPRDHPQCIVADPITSLWTITAQYTVILRRR